MAHKALGKSDRQGIALVHLVRMFRTEQSAQEWFESRNLAQRAHVPALRIDRDADRGPR